MQDLADCLMSISEVLGFPGGSNGKEAACSAGDLGSIPGLGRTLKKGMETHSSILAWRIPMDGGAWRATVHGVAKSRIQLIDSHSWVSECIRGSPFL